MSSWPEYVRGVTTHSRRGKLKNAFRYTVDYVLIDPDSIKKPLLFGRNYPGIMSVYDSSHGGKIRSGSGACWARNALAARGLVSGTYELKLLTQPGFFGHVFNPVSFWLAFRDNALVAVISEVSTPFKDRHSYLTHLPDFTPISTNDTTEATKKMHVSPFQDVAGDYTFTFAVEPKRLAIRILYRNGEEGVIATLSGSREPLSNYAIIRSSLRRPLGTIRTVFLIHWQALKLNAKGAVWRPRPTPPAEELS